MYFSGCGTPILDQSLDVSHLHVEKHTRTMIIIKVDHISLRLPERSVPVHIFTP
jgi:hypothetical protein